jgi:type I restriction enzyme R subunit
MVKGYSEDILIEQTCIQLFRETLNWEVENVYHNEAFGVNGTLGRNSEADVLLRYKVLDALRKFNSELPEQAYQNAFDELDSGSSIISLAELNQEKYTFLKDGIPVTYKNEQGEIITNKRLKIFDFENPENNHFLAVQQMWIEGKSKRRRRPDIIGFVNGIPLLFIELKAHHRKLKAAYEDNLTDYKDVIPKLFHCNAFIILSNGLESKIGAITSRYEHFNDWKRIEENQEGIVSLDTIIKGICEKNRFIDLFENFILFDTSIGQVIKLIARNHQFIGVNKAIRHFEQQQIRYNKGEISKEEAQRLGVFWHTQGSGKSYSMVFLCQKIHRKLHGSYTFLLVTDRNELDKQIYGTFAGVGAVNNKKLKANSGEKLKELLKTDSRFIFTLIHKFNFEDTITERDNIIVISDEAHRTQGGTLAVNMRNALPNASFMGFTGTPLFTHDELTRRIFGDYVSIYDFKRSIEDGATVPLYYENRGEKLKLDNPQINEEIRNAIEDADLDSKQEEKLKLLFQREYPVLTAKKRLKAIAKDVVEHFNERGYKGKAMFVAIDKITAVKMYNYITLEWEKYIKEQEKAIEKISDLQEQLIRRRELEWTKETEIAVVVSSEQNEIRKFKAWDLDIEPHREKMNTRDLEKEFKEEDHPFRLVIVCAMWITGFDVPSLSTLYLDKPLKSHTLMQTIARANRVHSGKNNGLIVDYIETYKALLEALAIYAIGGEKGGSGEDGTEMPVRPLEELISDLKDSIETVFRFFKDELNFDLQEVVDTEGLDLLFAISKGVDAVYTTDETKSKFGVMAREVFIKYKALMPDQSINQFKPQRDAINAIYQRIQDQTDEADISAVMKQIQDVVDDSIESKDILLAPTEDYGKKVDLSMLDFELIEKHFLKLTNKNTIVQTLKQKIEKQLQRMVDQNPLRVDFYKKYQEIIDEYNRGKERVTIEETFKELIKFIRELSEEEARSKREELTEEQLAIFDLLLLDKQLTTSERNKIKKMAQELLDKLQNTGLKVEHWIDKPQTQSAVRKTINDFLFENLPYPTYNDPDINQKTELVFEHLKMVYSAA